MKLAPWTSSLKNITFCFYLQWTDEDFESDEATNITIPSLCEVGTGLYGRMVVPVLIQVMQCNQQFSH